MKKTKAIQLGSFAAIAAAMSACGPSGHVVGVDPCQPATFQPQACQMAIAQHGYAYQGTFFPMYYPSPYMGYYGGYNTYVARGGRVYAPSRALYGRGYMPPSTRLQSVQSNVESRGSYLGRSLGARAGTVRTSGLSVGGRSVAISRGGIGATAMGRGAAS